MKKIFGYLTGAVVFLAATPAFAQEPVSTVFATNWVAITSGFAMATASAVCALAMARATAASAEGIARNPSAAGAIRFALILGLALIESLALYTLVIIFVKVV